LLLRLESDFDLSVIQTLCTKAGRHGIAADTVVQYHHSTSEIRDEPPHNSSPVHLVLTALMKHITHHILLSISLQDT